MGQSKLYDNIDFSSSIIDTVNIPTEGEFYLLDISDGKPNLDVIVRKLNEKYAIIRSGKSQSFGQKKYFKLSNSWKLSSRLTDGKYSLSNQELFSVKCAEFTDARFLESYDEIELVRIIKNAHIALIRTTADFVISELIYDPNIEYIDRADHQAREESPIRQYNMDLNRINYARHNFPHLNGKNMSISVKEHSIFEGDIDLVGRVILDENSSLEFTQHAKEMGTLIAGKGNSFKTGEGVVPEAKLVCTNFSLLFAEPVSYYDVYGIKLQNHSYGTGIENYYSNESISYDQITVDQPELVHVFSAGNLGDQAPEEGTYAGIEGYANLTGTFKQAKNVLVIGALDSTGNHVDRSSCGPTYDGRMKPELCAFGGEGSSESAALTSGVVAMIQHHHRELYGNYPSASMVKSLLITGADDVHTPGIDFKTGYGSINLSNSILLLDSGWFVEDVIFANSVNSLELTVPENVHELKVVVSWIDHPANPEDATALINDLDMTVVSPSNVSSLPWVLNTNPDATSLAALPVRGEDHLNNAELITIQNPESGIYTINIISNELEGDAQPFSVAYHLAYKDHFNWTFPTASDLLEAGSHVYFRWDNTYPSQDADLLVRYGQGNWESVGVTDINNGYFNYVLKDTSSYAQLRMVFLGNEILSDTFTITRLSQLVVENDCVDEFILSWNSIKNAAYYTLFELKDGQLAEMLATVDTIVTINKTTYTGSYYAIQPVFSNSLKGLRSYAINYEDNNKGCYLNNFLAFLSQNDLANIRLSVNLPLDIETISIQKEQHGIQQLFAEFSPGSKSYFEFEDADLTPGRVGYSAQLSLYDGSFILSDTLSFYYTNKETVIIFPNPVYGDFISVLNDFPGGSLQLLDERGRFIQEYDLVNMVDPLELTGLRRDMYIFRIFYRGEMVHSGKLIRR